MKQKVTREQFDLMKALSTGKRAKSTTFDPDLGIPVTEVEEYDVEADLLERFEIVEPGDG